MNSRFRIALNTRLWTATPSGRASQERGIQKGSPPERPRMATSRASRRASRRARHKGTALVANVAAVATNTRCSRRARRSGTSPTTAFDSEVVTLELTENYATSAADVTAMGFVPLAGDPDASRASLAAGRRLVKTGKGRGEGDGVGQAAKGYQGSFAAQVSPDPIGTWAVLPGSGKSRKLAGYATGTKLWVQFAAVRHGVQSGWCTPVLVTIP